MEYYAKYIDILKHLFFNIFVLLKTMSNIPKYVYEMVRSLVMTVEL